LLSDEVALGNAAIQDRMGGDVAGVSSPDRGVAGVAGPLVTRASLALHLDPSDPARLARLVELIQASHLPDRDHVVARLHAAEATRARVDAALSATFGAADPATRERAEHALSAVAASLANGSLDGSSWRDANGQIDLGLRGVGGSIVDRAAGWIEGIANARGPEPGLGRATSDLCRALLALTFDEEEEEDDWGPDPEVAG
jgi:hypothetical protein